MKNVNLPREFFFGRSILIASRLPKFKENFQRLTRFCGKNCLSWLIFSIGPKMSLKPNISKKCIFSVKRMFWPTRLTDYDRPQVTFLLGSKVFPAFFVRAKKSLCNTQELVENTNFWENAFGHLKCCWKQFLLRGRLFFSWKKWFGKSIFESSTLTNLEKQFARVHKVLWVLVRKMRDYSNGTYEPKRSIQL